jgi:hypothetical protein
MWKGGLVGLAIVAAVGQTSDQAPQPYAGLQSRDIKALSDQDIADLKAARGMGLAFAAELNGYPGPRHVLELAAPLGLSEQQRHSMGQLFEAMKDEAVALGERLITAERDLDRDFAARTITPERLKAATATIAALRGELQETHLKYHLSTAALLNPDQMRRYGELRGYAGTAAVHRGHADRPRDGTGGRQDE